MSIPKRKILFLIPSLVSGGAERTLINLLHRIDYDKYDIDLAIASYNGVYIDQVPPQVKVIPLFKNNFFVRVLAYLQRRYGFTSILKWRVRSRIKGSYDTGISFLDSNFTELLFFVKKMDKKISWVHSSYMSNTNFTRFNSNKKYREKLVRERYSKLDTIVFVSQDAMDEFVQVFGSYPNMKVVYNLIDAKGVKAKALQQSNITGPGFLFLAMGSLFAVKGFDRLIRAAKILKDKGCSFSLYIVGQGPLEKQLTAQIEELGLKEHVKLLGFHSNPYPILQQSDVFVMSSVSEALPTVLCEAMILGKPVVVTNCSGCRELVDHEKYGLMAEQDDASLANKMMVYLDDKAALEFYTQKARERGVLFDDEKMLREYYSILDS